MTFWRGLKLVAEWRVAWLGRHWYSQTSQKAEPRQEMVKNIGTAMAIAMGKEETESGSFHQDDRQKVVNQMLKKRRGRNQGHM